MENLPKIIAAYIAMDQRAKDDNLKTMEADAIRYPAPGIPKLRLVVGRVRK